ncbi:hypothetical protein ACFSAV_02265 [Pasteurella oralis]|uniref:Transmembrane protein n=1 Tax=Pasteurella oralis TaxID=1071947 RepID=A0ABW4NRG0_9PAST
MDNKQINTKQYLLKITKNALLGILSVIIAILAIAFVVTILEQREIAMREMQGISDNRMLPAYMMIFIMGIIYLINSIIIMIPSIIFIIYRKLTKNWKNIFYALIIYIITLLLFFKFVLPFIGIFLFIYYFSSYALYIHIAIALIIFWFMLPKLNDF